MRVADALRGQLAVVLGARAAVHLIDGGRAQQRLGAGDEGDRDGADQDRPLHDAHQFFRRRQDDVSDQMLSGTVTYLMSVKPSSAAAPMPTMTPTSGAGNRRQLFGASAFQPKIVAMVRTPMPSAWMCGSALADGVHQRRGDADEVLDAGADRLVVEHDVELRGEDQHADAGQHAVDHGRRHGAEPLTELAQAGDELDEAGEQDDDADHLEAELLDELPDQHRQAGGRAAHLQRRTRDGADDDAADDAGDDAGRRRHAGGERNAHAQRQRHEEDDDRRQEIATEGRRREGLRVHSASVRSLFHLPADVRWPLIANRFQLSPSGAGR